MDELSTLVGSEEYGACADAASGIYRELAQEPPYSFDKDAEMQAEKIYMAAMTKED